jgi:hypothetical protein
MISLRSKDRTSIAETPKQVVTGNQECANETDKFIYEQVKIRYEFEHTRTTNLDNKSSNLVGWIGLIISVLSLGSGILFNADTPFKISINQLALLISVFVFLLGSLFFSLVAYRVKGYGVVPNPPTDFIVLYVRGGHKEVLAAVTKAMANVTVTNAKQNDKKVTFIKLAWILFLVGMITTSISIFAIMNILIR